VGITFKYCLLLTEVWIHLSDMENLPKLIDFEEESQHSGSNTPHYKYSLHTPISISRHHYRPKPKSFYLPENLTMSFLQTAFGQQARSQMYRKTAIQLAQEFLKISDEFVREKLLSSRARSTRPLVVTVCNVQPEGRETPESISLHLILTKFEESQMKVLRTSIWQGEAQQIDVVFVNRKDLKRCHEMEGFLKLIEMRGTRFFLYGGTSSEDAAQGMVAQKGPEEIFTHGELDTSLAIGSISWFGVVTIGSIFVPTWDAIAQDPSEFIDLMETIARPETLGLSMMLFYPKTVARCGFEG
jgi:hypothetical protein